MENIDLIEIGIKALLGTLSVFLYAVWKVRDHLSDFKMWIFIKHNKAYWIWCIVFLYTILIIVSVHPPTSSSIKSMIGLDVSGEATSFLTLGWGLSLMVNSLNNKKLNKKTLSTK